LPAFHPEQFRNSLIVAVNGVSQNYLEDYQVVKSGSDIIVTFSSDSGVTADDNIAVTYQAAPDAVAALNY
jgi:hypothetical protein